MNNLYQKISLLLKRINLRSKLVRLFAGRPCVRLHPARPPLTPTPSAIDSARPIATSPPPPHPQRIATSPPPSRRGLASANAPRPRLRHPHRRRSWTPLHPQHFFCCCRSWPPSLSAAISGSLICPPPRPHLCLPPRLRCNPSPPPLLRPSDPSPPPNRYRIDAPRIANSPPNRCARC
jgi:hypothetical protein